MVSQRNLTSADVAGEGTLFPPSSSFTTFERFTAGHSKRKGWTKPRGRKASTKRKARAVKWKWWTAFSSRNLYSLSMYSTDCCYRRACRWLKNCRVNRSSALLQAAERSHAALSISSALLTGHSTSSGDSRWKRGEKPSLQEFVTCVDAVLLS